MMAKRVIPCLDVHDGKVTRGVQFGIAEKGGLRNVGDPVELALRYNEQGADEMVFFDITATAHGRGTMVDVIERAADQCFMPLTVGGDTRQIIPARPAKKIYWPRAHSCRNIVQMFSTGISLYT